MIISEEAQKRLKKLLPANSNGFRYIGHVGTCRGSTPILKPAQKPAEDESVIESYGIVFYVTEENFERLDRAIIDYDPSFMGKGLTMNWHKDGCACNH